MTAMASGLKSKIGTVARELLGDSTYTAMRHPKMVQRGFQEYSKLFQEIEGPKNILLCCPEYTNIGDHAIALAECRMLQQSVRPLLVLSGNTTKVLKCLKKYVSREDSIFLTGGGNMGTLYRNEEEYRLNVISLLKHNRIVLFPQTMSYDDTAESQRFLRHTQRVYGAHPDLHLFAREQVSYERMRKAYPNNDVQLVPDIVLSVQGEDNADFAKRHGVLLCMRNDVEKTMTDSSRQMIEQIAAGIDPEFKYTDTTIDSKYAPISQEQGKQLVLDKWEEFKHARLVITDRLHGMIFSAITGTPCVALNNSNGKVGFEYEWLKDLPYIGFVNDSTDETAIIKAIKTVMEAESTDFASAGLDQQFGPLVTLIP
ncbi:polysaccharide pyruvyl transferase family protein [Bifidobacterium pullorum]